MEEEYDVEGLKDEIKALANIGGTMDASTEEINKVAAAIDSMSEIEIVSVARQLGIPIENYQLSNENRLTN